VIFLLQLKSLGKFVYCNGLTNKELRPMHLLWSKLIFAFNKNSAETGGANSFCLLCTPLKLIHFLFCIPRSVANLKLKFAASLKF
jgi:hypothetical protein